MASVVAAIRPGPWLRELTALKPAQWNWSRSLRMGIGIGLPMIVGLLTHQMGLALWVAMGALFQGSGERAGPYAGIFRKVLISAPLGALGMMLGYLGAAPWGVVVLVMALVAFVAGIVSTYSSALSTGSLQAMVMGTVAIGNPELGSFWQPALALLGGALFYSALLGVEALVRRQRPQRDMMASLLQALAALARVQAQGQPVDAARLQVTSRLADLYGLMLETRYHAWGRNPTTDHLARGLKRCDTVFALLLASQDHAALQSAAERLDELASRYARGQGYALSATSDEAALARAVASVAAALWGQVPADDADSAPAPRRAERRLLAGLDRLVPGRDAVLSALALALCTAIGFSMFLLDDRSHWYWVPMTVCIVMKPDLGSVFARAVLRSAGTSAGVVVGAGLLALLPYGPVFIAVIVLIAMLMPWAAQRSYALMTFTLTPLVLVLIDFISPETKDVNYALLRLVDTLLGACIVLVFGYLIWPRRHGPQLARGFHDAREAIAAYLRATLPDTPQAAQALQHDGLGAYRRAAYGKLADMRAQLQKSLAEPAPAGREAAAWFPLVTSAERVCDGITAYAIDQNGPPRPELAAQLATLAGLIAAGRDDVPGLDARQPTPDTPAGRLIETLHSELVHVHGMSEPVV